MSEQKSKNDYRNEVLLEILLDELFSDAYLSSYDMEPRLHFQISKVGEKIIHLMRPERCKKKLDELMSELELKKESSDES